MRAEASKQRRGPQGNQGFLRVSYPAGQACRSRRAVFSTVALLKTTLKRGIGRGGVLEENGHSVLPPSAMTPMTRYRAEEPPSRSGIRTFGRIVMWLAIAILMVVVAFAAGAYLFFHQSVAAIQAHSRDAKEAQTVLGEPPPPGHAAIALVIGYDHRANEAANTPSRSDTVMLIRTDPATHTISLMSFPRDLVVNVHCPGQPVFAGKINSAYATCGSKGTVQTVSDLIGAADQLPDHGELPRLQEDREQPRRRLDRRRPPVLQQQRRSEPDLRLREDQPAAGVPAPHRRERARLRPLPAHRLRPVPRRAPAAVREGDEVPARAQLLRDEGPEDRRDHAEEHRGRRRRWGRRQRQDHPQLRVLPVAPPFGPLLPDADPGSERLRRPPHRPLEHLGGRAGLADPGPRLGEGRNRGRAGTEGEAAHASAEGDHDHRPQRQRRRGLGRPCGRRALPTRLPHDSAAGERDGQRAELRLLPHHDLLEPARAGARPPPRPRSRSCSPRRT